MKLSRQWLQRYVDIADKSTEQIEDALTLIGFEVEGIETFGLPELEHVQVGEVVSFEQHPNADRLRLCQVRVSQDEDPRAIVCGASNFKQGDRVMVALPGAKLPTPDGTPFKIKKSKIRGEASYGMLCAASELGLAKQSEGIMILGERPEVGTPVNTVFSDSDTIFDIEVTPNRPDCLSHVGMARELAAYFNRPLSEPQPALPSLVDEPALISAVDVQTPTCPLYYAWSIRGLKVGPSPEWLQKALESVGLRPINNVVDITNFVLLETGQPLHAFDANKIGGGKLVVRQATEGETITTLDDKARTLTERMAVIADAHKPLVIAGVMGSVTAEVDDSTTDVVLEAAHFSHADIRFTSRRLALSSDSSYRFERGVDPQRTALAATRALELLCELCGGRVSKNNLQVGTPAEGPAPISVKPSFFKDYCGFGPDEAGVQAVLERLGLSVSGGQDGNWQVALPSFRRDLERPVDLVEEFLRIYGTDKIPESTVSAVGMHRADAPLAAFNAAAASQLAAKGFCECVHYSLRDSKEVGERFGSTALETLGLTNPLQSDQTHLRPSLLPGLVDAVRHNLSHGNDVRGFFEIGRVFRSSADQPRGSKGDAEGIWELASVACVLLPEVGVRQWMSREKPDLFTLKAYAQELLELAGVRRAQIFENVIPAEDGQPSLWQTQHAATCGAFTQEGFSVTLGTLDLKWLKARDVLVPVLACEWLFSPEFFNKERKRAHFKPYASQPASTRDLALLVDRWEPAESVRGDLEGLARKSVDKGDFSVEQVDVFDLYEGKGLPEGKKSLALSFSYRAEGRTLTDAEVNGAFEALQSAVSEQGRYTIRK